MTGYAQQTGENSAAVQRVAANLVGWVGVLLITAASSWFAFWGVIEAFHEGWCKPTLGMRLIQLAAYLSPATVLCALAALGLRWPHIGATLFVLVGSAIAALIVADGASFGLFLTMIITAVPIFVGLLFLVGRPRPKWAAYAGSVAIPLLIMIGFGVEPVVRVSTRFNDGNLRARLVEGNGVTLLWAPAGPGWARNGLVSWDEAVQRARHLNEEGTALADQPQDIWHLPNREEVVRSLTRSGRNAGGTWDPQSERPSYVRLPDKESPLWDPYAPLIYLWTNEEDSRDRAWIVVYHGGVFTKPKAAGWSSLGFRAVRDASRQTSRTQSADAVAVGTKVFTHGQEQGLVDATEKRSDRQSHSNRSERP
jgi:hypothetical protein